MRIGILTSVLTEGPSGVGWHIARLVEQLAVLAPQHEFVLFERTLSGVGLPDDHVYAGYPPDTPNARRVPVHCPAWFYRHARLTYQTRVLARAVARERLDLLHGAGQQLPAKRDVPQLLTVHDLANAEVPIGPVKERQRAKGLFVRYLGWADRLIAVSKFTRDDLAANFDVPREKVRVIYEGGRPDGDEAPTTDAPPLPPPTHKPYVLYVGALEARRNLGFLLRAFAELKDTLGDGYSLVLAGRPDPTEDHRLRLQVRTLNLGDDVVFLGQVDPARVTSLYAGASAFVLPSLHEGFGMVALEAMAHGVPVIAAKAGALPEVVGDAGLLVELNDASALAQQLQRVLTDGPLALDLIRRGEKHAKHFSWRRMAEQTLELYESIVAETQR